MQLFKSIIPFTILKFIPNKTSFLKKIFEKILKKKKNETKYTFYFSYLLSPPPSPKKKYPFSNPLESILLDKSSNPMILIRFLARNFFLHRELITGSHFLYLQPINTCRGSYIIEAWMFVDYQRGKR